MKLLAKYNNGNYTVKIFSDGTKIRYNDLDNFTPEFAECMDVTITNKCNGGCKWCYLNCTEEGKHADLHNPIFDSVHAGTEMAINANDLTHPDLEEFLIKMRDKGVIVNITINQMHLISELSKLKEWQSKHLIWGIGISLTNSKDTRLFDAISQLKNTVIHVIDGCFTKADLENLANHNICLLVLGFKHKGRGLEYYELHKDEVDSNIQFLKEHIYDYKHQFNGFGFDNLASDDLNIRSIVGEEKWEQNHMGEEGEFTYFFDAVNKKFAISSMETEMYDALDTVDDMFKTVRKMQGFS